jgi:uncharacterized phage-associated protein
MDAIGIKQNIYDKMGVERMYYLDGLNYFLPNLTIYTLVVKFCQQGKTKDGAMSNITFEFNQRKAIETILYLANKISDSDIYGICKLLYLADKISLERYGRFIFGESYFALKEGATPSNAYDLLKQATNPTYEGLKVEGNQVIGLREAKLDYLSDSDIECLDIIINKYGLVSNVARGKDAHDTAWRQAWEKRGAKRSIGMSVTSIAEQLSGASDLVDYLSNSDAR